MMSPMTVHDNAYMYHNIILFALFIFTYIFKHLSKVKFYYIHDTTSVRTVVVYYIHWLSHFSRINFYVAEVNTNRPEIFRFLFQTRFVHENLSAAAKISDQKLCQSVTVFCSATGGGGGAFVLFLFGAPTADCYSEISRVSTLSCSFIRIRPY